jgi:4'-phosphopantetheinyl transferase
VKIAEQGTGNRIWTSTVHPVVIDPDEVYVWLLCLNDPHATTRLYPILSAEEKQRAAQFRFDRDRDRFIVARGGLRLILGWCLDLPPYELTFAYSAYGKPALPKGLSRHDLRFNISHSGEIAVLGVANGRELGIDIEQIRHDVDMELVATRFFSAAEQAALQEVPKNRKLDSFYACWTRKEAFIKALGQGLSLPLDSFDVSLTPGLPPQILAARSEPQPWLRWSLQEINVGPGYQACLAVEGRIGKLHMWEASMEISTGNFFNLRSQR